MPRSAAEEVADLTLRRNAVRGFEEAELGRIQHRCRAAVGGLLDVDPAEVALVPNTSYGVNLAAHLVAATREPGRIVLSDGEFPANVLPWRALESKGFEVVLVPTDDQGNPREDALLEAVAHPSTRALSVSFVQFVTGYRMDLAALGRACRSAGALFCVDAIQGLGAVPFRPRDVDADVVACGGQKWLCGPWGSGFAWIRPELTEDFDPPMVSWLATRGGADFDHLLHYRMEWRRDARKYELATNGIQDYLGLARSIEVLLEVGVDRIQDHLTRILAPVHDWISERAGVRSCTPGAAQRRAGIVSFRGSGVARYASALEDAGVVASVREGALRLAPHFYTTADELLEVVEILDRVPGA